MKTTLVILILCCASLSASAQKSSIVTPDSIVSQRGNVTTITKKDTIIILRGNDTTVYMTPGYIMTKSNGKKTIVTKGNVITTDTKDTTCVDSETGLIYGVSTYQDTTEIKLFGKKIVIVDSDNGTHVNIGKDTDEETDEDSTKTKEPKNVHLKPFAMDLGFNTYLYEGDFLLPKKYYMLRADVFKSRNVNLHFLVTKINLYQHHWHFVTSLDMIYNNFAMEEKSTLIPKSDSIVAFIDTTVNFTKDKLLARYFSVPFLLQYQSKADKRKSSFRMAAGFEIGLRSKSLTKQVSDERGKVKFMDDYNLEDIQYGITARIGYGCIDFYANYSLSNLFKKAEGPELHTLSAGIALIGF